MKLEQRKKRALLASNYIVNNNATIRQTAQNLGYPKATVHKDVTYFLLKFYPDKIELYNQVKKILANNKKEGQVKGGKRTYSNKK